MRQLHETRSSPSAALSHGREPTRRGPAPLATTEERLAWYRERDNDAADLHRRYVRAKFQMNGWSDADLARFHRYRRDVSREHAARLVLARRFALRGLTAAAAAALVAGLIYAAFRWWKWQQVQRALPAARATTTVKRGEAKS